MIRKKFLNFIFCLIILVIMTLEQGCQNINYMAQNNKKNLSIAIESNTSEDFKYINTILDNFKNSHKNYDVSIINGDNLKDIKQDIMDKKYDIIISSRETFLTLNEYGVIKNLTSYFNQNKSQSKFYDIVFSYGKVGDKNLGMGLMPSSIEVLYNKNNLSNILDDSSNLEYLKSITANKNFKIPYVLPKDLNINLALSSIVSNSIIKENNLVSIYNGDKNKYLDVVDIPKMFKYLNILNADYKINGERLIKSDIGVLESLNSGEIPFVITTSGVAENLDYSNIDSLSNLGINTYEVTPPILSRYIVYATSSSENITAINKFFDYMISDNTYEPLAKEGIITGNKKADSNFTGLNKVFLTSISKGNENNIPYFLNLPEKFMTPLNNKLTEIIDYNKYDSNYWNEIVSEALE